MFIKDFDYVIPYDQKVCVCEIRKDGECVDSYVGTMLKIPNRFRNLEINHIRTLKPEFMSICVSAEE